MLVALPSRPVKSTTRPAAAGSAAPAAAVGTGAGCCCGCCAAPVATCEAMSRSRSAPEPVILGACAVRPACLMHSFGAGKGAKGVCKNVTFPFHVLFMNNTQIGMVTSHLKNALRLFYTPFTCLLHQVFILAVGLEQPALRWRKDDLGLLLAGVDSLVRRGPLCWARIAVVSGRGRIRIGHRRIPAASRSCAGTRIRHTVRYERGHTTPKLLAASNKSRARFQTRAHTVWCGDIFTSPEPCARMLAKRTEEGRCGRAGVPLSCGCNQRIHRYTRPLHQPAAPPP